MTERSSSATVVRDVVAAGDRRRRQRAVARTLARAVPLLAGLVLVAGLAMSAVGWSAVATLGLTVLLAAGVSAWAVASTRLRPTTDQIAAAVDADAGLSGELRSAHWFAEHPSDSPWAVFHVQEAARRSSAIPWTDVYPKTQARGAWLGAAVLVLAAFGVPAGLPQGGWLPVSVPAAAEEAVTLEEMEGLPPDLRDKLLELLAAVREGALTPVEAMAALRELTEFAKVDAAMKDQIAQLLDEARANREAFDKINAPRQADAGKMTDDVEWARENMESRLASEEAMKAAEDAARGGESKPEDSQEPGPTTEQSADGEKGEASEGQPGAKVPAKPADAADGASVMMLGNPSSTVGEPGSVFGGKRGNVKYGTSQASDISASLKREMVEAVVNTDKSDLDKDDRRRKTQQSWSSLAYTRSGSRSSFDRARTDAVRTVPEARKPVLERYFVRPAASEEQTSR